MYIYAAEIKRDWQQVRLALKPRPHTLEPNHEP